MLRVSICLMFILVAVLLTAEDFIKISDDLRNVISSELVTEEQIPVYITLNEQYNSEQLYKRAVNHNKRERRQLTITTLKRFSNDSQKELREVLEQLETKQLVQNIRYHWLYNAIGLSATKEALQVLDNHPDVKAISYDSYPDVVFENSEMHSVTTNEAERSITWNLNIMNVPDVWDLGYKGEGVLVAVLDSGVNIHHHDLVNRLWMNEDYPNHGYNFMDNNHNVTDNSGHGTHIAGTIAGDGTSGYRCGIAPLSRIMALKVRPTGSTGDLQQSVVWSAMEFAIEHDVDILNMSLGWRSASDVSKSIWRTVLQNTLSAGLLAPLAAGNEGNSQSGTIIIPAISPPPWLHPDQTEIGGLTAAIAIGASNSSDNIASFSSRGPTTWQQIEPFYDYPLNPEIGLIRPDVITPGDHVLSLSPSDNSGYGGMSGTSSATPNAAGVMALLLSKNPELTPEDVGRILELTALRFTDTKSNIYGSGRVDALAAIIAALLDEPPHQAANPNPSLNEPAVYLNPQLKWRDGGFANGYLVYLGTDTPPTNLLNGEFTQQTDYQIIEELDYATQYYWRIDAQNDYGVTTGDVWSFRTVHPVSEDFETGDFSTYEWQLTTTGSNPEEWFITDQTAKRGTYSARSGNIGHNSSTTMSMRLNINEDGVVTFYRKVSTEQNYDHLRFYIDNTLVGQWSGQADWQREVFPVSAGYRAFRWVYTKDPMTSVGEDAIWIDEITFPPHPLPPVKYPPNNVSHTLDYAAIRFSWELEDNDESIDPILFNHLGYNLYRRAENEEEYQQLNDEFFTGESYTEPYDEAGIFSYFLTALYRVMGREEESEPSETITVEINPPLSMPLITPSGGEFFGEVEVSLEPSEFLEGIELYYTLDSTEPTFDSELYSEPIMIESSALLKVRSYKVGYLAGEIATEQYEIVHTSVDENPIPEPLSIKVYPNPIISQRGNLRESITLTIDYYLDRDYSEVDISIYNIKGQKIRSFEQLSRQKGKSQLSWDFTSENGKKAANGFYLIRLTTDQDYLTGRFLLLK